MATARSILKSYFLTGKKPTQGQFAALIDSFLHLSEDSLSISQITNLATVLAGKASTQQLAGLVKSFTAYPITITPTSTLITINWDTAKIAAHGPEPFDIQLYEINTDGSMQKSTALLTVNAAKTVYSFYVGENSNLNFLYKII